MWPLFRYHLVRLRGSILGWSVPLALIGGYMIPFYSRLGEHRALLEELVKAYPKELLVFFGGQEILNAISTPEGFLHVELFSYLPLVLGIFAVLSGSGLLAADEEAGLLDLFLSLPISRTRLFLIRWAALILAIILILFLIWIGLVVGKATSEFPLSVGDLLLPLADVAMVLIFISGLAFALSQILPSRRSAAMLSGIILVVSFFLNGLAELDEDVVAVARLLPLYYYQGGEILQEVKVEWWFGRFIASTLLWGMGWWRFLRRDIRVSGEGEWSLPRRRKREKRRQGVR